MRLSNEDILVLIAKAAKSGIDRKQLQVAYAEMLALCHEVLAARALYDTLNWTFILDRPPEYREYLRAREGK